MVLSPDVKAISCFPADQCVSAMEAVLREAGIDNWRQEARWMREELVRQNCPENLHSWLQRRIDGEPFQYILGNTEFYDLVLQVGPGVLVPRPETELLVETVLNVCHSPNSGTPNAELTICDLCTGSGAIALALAANLPGSRICGVDISPEALLWADRNKRQLSLDNVEFFLGDLFSPFEKENSRKFSVITANPPYVSESEYAVLPSVVKDYEPRLALVADDNGLDIIRRIAAASLPRLHPGGFLIMEIGCDQGAACNSILGETGYADIRILKDYTGRDRFCTGYAPF